MAGPGLHVPLPAIIFISIIAGMLVVLLLFCMYLNKMACFANCGGCDCFEEKKESKKEKKKSQLGESYGYDDDDSSSDSDNEMLLRYEHYVSSTKETKGNAKKTRSGSFRAKSSSSLRNGGGTTRPLPIFKTLDERQPRVQFIYQSI